MLSVALVVLGAHRHESEGGEDAYFVLDNDMGVFDGVGGWAAMGHDPGVFTRGFAKAVKGGIHT